MENRLYKKYKETIAAKIQKELGLENVMQVPRLQKIAINVGVGGFRENREALDSFVSELVDITGQKPYHRKARLSEAGFKIKQGDIVGYAVTLRGNKMWAFLDKFVNIALPRVRDFRGLESEAFDNAGNYSVGIREHVIFPEVNQNAVKGIRGLQVKIVMSGRDKEMNKTLLSALGMPFKKDTK